MICTFGVWRGIPFGVLRYGHLFHPVPVCFWPNISSFGRFRRVRHGKKFWVTINWLWTSMHQFCFNLCTLSTWANHLQYLPCSSQRLMESSLHPLKFLRPPSHHRASQLWGWSWASMPSDTSCSSYIGG